RRRACATILQVAIARSAFGSLLHVGCISQRTHLISAFRLALRSSAGIGEEHVPFSPPLHGSRALKAESSSGRQYLGDHRLRCDFAIAARSSSATGACLQRKNYPAFAG